MENNIYQNKNNAYILGYKSVELHQFIIDNLKTINYEKIPLNTFFNLVVESLDKIIFRIKDIISKSIVNDIFEKQ